MTATAFPEVPRDSNGILKRPSPEQLGDILRLLFPEERMRLLDALDGKPPGATKTLKQYIQLVKPAYQFYWHIELLIDVLQDVADDLIFRVMVFEPPRH